MKQRLYLLHGWPVLLHETMSFLWFLYTQKLYNDSVWLDYSWDLLQSNCTLLSKWPSVVHKNRACMWIAVNSPRTIINPLMICDFITFHPPANLLSAVKTPSFKYRTASRRRNPRWHFETTPLIFSKGHGHKFIYIFFFREDQMRSLQSAF